MTNTSNRTRYSKLRRHVIVLSILGTFAVVAFGYTTYRYRSHFSGDLSNDQAIWGQYGDFIGGVLNPVFALLALFALLYTIVLQVRELEQTREEIGKTVAASKYQTFESTFFQILRLHNDNVAAIRIEQYGTDPLLLAHGKKTTHTGRAALYQHAHLMQDAIDKQTTTPDTTLDTGGDQVRRIRDGFARYYSKFGTDLGNYFVTIHEILSFIQRCPDDETDLTTYARLVRSQLSSWEVLLLAYYCMADQQLSTSMTELVNDYAMLRFLEPHDYDKIRSTEHFSDTAFDFE